MRRTADITTHEKSGFTLLEIMMAMGIFSIVILAFLQILMSVHRTNKALAASMTANSVIRTQADEALGAAAENAAAFGNYARSFVNYYGTQIAIVNSLAIEDTLPIGPNGTRVPRVRFENGDRELIYTFAVPEPGFSSRYVATTQTWSDGAAPGDLIPYPYGIGELRVYLSESAMPNKQGDLTGRPPITNSQNVEVAWETRGNDGDTGDALFENEAGVVFNGEASLRNPPEGLNRIFADITVTYFEDPEHINPLSINTRRLLVIGSIDTRDLYGI